MTTSIPKAPPSHEELADRHHRYKAAAITGLFANVSFSPRSSVEEIRSLVALADDIADYAITLGGR